MLSSLETLWVFSKLGTMQETASFLRVTQPTVSKRISALEHDLGRRLIVKNGRKAVLTKDAVALIDKMVPHLIGLKDLVQIESRSEHMALSVAWSESLLASWGARVSAKLMSELEQVTVTFHAHRSVGVIDRIKSGSYEIGICAGRADSAPELLYKQVGFEDYCLYARKSKAENPGAYLVIEKASSSAEATSRSLQKLKLHPLVELESYSCMISLAEAGVGSAVVPKNQLRGRAKKGMICRAIPVRRPISVVYRRSFVKDPARKNFLNQLIAWCEKELEK